MARSNDIVLCFHNLPPMFSNAAPIICYVHNVFVIDDYPLSNRFSWIRIRLKIERIIANYFKRRITRYAVQTALMRDRLARWFGDNPPPIDIFPFAPSALISPQPPTNNEDEEICRGPEKQQWDFIYPSDGSPHKNHLRLFAAWRELADAGHFPSLVVTLDPHKDIALVNELEELSRTSSIRIVNLGRLNYNDVAVHYRTAAALIFPSLVESYGLPLIEAANLQLPILAPELDYVRQVCEPSQTFDPRSPHSIASAVLRHQGVPLQRHFTVPASVFLEFIHNVNASSLPFDVPSVKSVFPTF